MMEGILRLPDGRQLGYGVYGPPDGVPILDFHGIPGSRLEAALFAEYIQRPDLCFIGFDRPGFGRSTPLPGRSVADIGADVRSLVDHLKIERFIALGYSGGGPFALACAHQMPERIRALGIVSGVGPVALNGDSQGMHESNRKKFNLAQKMPWLARLMLSFAFASLRRQPQRLERQMRSIWAQMPEPDRLALADPTFSAWIIRLTQDAISLSVNGWVHEEILMAQPWTFDLHAITCPNIYLWHGEQDRNVPLAMGKTVAARLPNCRSIFLPSEGHISLMLNHGAQIVAKLVAAQVFLKV
jgi:pimeloyl-ACP methyl ester carboxylesterase